MVFARAFRESIELYAIVFGKRHPKDSLLSVNCNVKSPTQTANGTVFTRESILDANQCTTVIINQPNNL